MFKTNDHVLPQLSHLSNLCHYCKTDVHTPSRWQYCTQFFLNNKAILGVHVDILKKCSVQQFGLCCEHRY